MAEHTSRRGNRAGLGGVRHLAQRWRSAISAAAPDPADEALVLTLLSPSESDLYWAMSTADRRHAVRSGVAIVTSGGDDELVVASALHDVGKTPAEIGTSGRVVASVVTLVLGRRRTAALGPRGGLVGRIGAYASHPEVGAEMLAAAGSTDTVSRWAAEHHQPLEESTLSAEAAALLWHADRA